MNKRDEFVKSLSEKEKVLGEFKNEYGEQFLLYSEKQQPGFVYITGDELDWSKDLFLYGELVIEQAFTLSTDEKKQIKSIFKKNNY